ncbi:hypothetical protein OE88DRAFT_1637159 [Heliocybe sulcata]|uniref:Uncharacterized protein n=1 Tax=Heliocybe sulcata TaxID=5364 RepID=A0A5C3MRR9_9AGAM|nr:hypothetical protein OE88DRAFT_1637159 [Heliocybe sulcata]
MSAILDIFKVKPFDIAPVLAGWEDGPHFSGKPKKDPPVAQWLDLIKAGCVQRQVPQEYWHEVAQHFMGKKARKRFEAVTKVLYEMNGENYRWTWKKFKLLMANVGWDIDPKKKVVVQPPKSTSSGTSWLTLRRKSQSQSDLPKASSSSFKPKLPTRSASSFLPWTQPNPDDSKPTKAVIVKPKLDDSKATPSTSMSRFFGRPVQTEPVSSNPLTDAIVQAPLWLFMAVDILETLSQEYPSAISALSAVLIIAGSIPAIPAVTTGAAGALLATHAAQTAGAAAVSFGTWLKTRGAADGKGAGSK